MSISNGQLVFVTVSCVVLYALILISFLFKSTGIDTILSINILTSFLFLLSWTIKQFRITTHYYDFPELFGLGFEILVFALSTLAIFYKPRPSWLVVSGYIFYGLHFVALLLFLVFALVFKMKRLL